MEQLAPYYTWSACPVSYSGLCPQIAILFSGGLDSSLLTYLVLEVIGAEKVAANIFPATEGEMIDLINVAFGPSPFEAPDRGTALVVYEEILRNVCPVQRNRIRLLCVDVSDEMVAANEELVLSLVYPKRASYMDFSIGAAFYLAMGEGRVVRPDFACDGANRVWWKTYAEAVKIENGFKSQSKHPDTEAHPLSGLKCSLCVLVAKPGCAIKACRLCCKRYGRREPSFICRVHPTETKLSTRRQREHGLVPPPCSIFVSDTPVKTESRVVIAGHGADELWGGYARYKTAERYGAARIEMIRDMMRLWDRNLGRDDRCVSSCGKELRHPFLDEHVVKLAAEIPFNYVFPTDSKHSTKPVLRALARRMGLSSSIQFRKRAIQFGSRAATESCRGHCPNVRKLKGTAQYKPRQQLTSVISGSAAESKGRFKPKAPERDINETKRTWVGRQTTSASPFGTIIKRLPDENKLKDIFQKTYRKVYSPGRDSIWCVSVVQSITIHGRALKALRLSSTHRGEPLTPEANALIAKSAMLTHFVNEYAHYLRHEHSSIASNIA